MERNETVFNCITKNWFKNFNSDLFIEIQPRSVPPSVADYDALKYKEENPTKSSGKHSEKLGTSSRGNTMRLLYQFKKRTDLKKGKYF